MSHSEEDFDPAGRRLCPDGSCNGLIGPDRRCKVCGTLDETAPVDAGATGEGDDDELEDEDETEDDDEDEDVENELAAAPDADGAWDENRQLCSDGNCIGVIGDDGKCKECGLPAPSS